MVSGTVFTKLEDLVIKRGKYDLEIKNRLHSEL